MARGGYLPFNLARRTSKVQGEGPARVSMRLMIFMYVYGLPANLTTARKSGKGKNACSNYYVSIK
jgi:hypothetical protein